MSPQKTLVATGPINFQRSFALQNLGQYDPTASLTEDCLTKSFATSNGSCSVVLRAVAGAVEVECDGEDADAVLAELTAALKAEDGYGSFAPDHPLLARLHREQAGLRLIRFPWMFDIACSAVLQQRVRGTDAMTDWRHLAERCGGRGPTGQAMFPSAATLAAVPLWRLEALGIDVQRSRTLLALAREVKLHPLRAVMTYTQLRLRLGRIPGVGPWTVETVLGFGAGDVDALPLGDLYLPRLVAYALADEPQGTDERMLELLEPFRGQRFRVARLLYGSGISVPRSYEPRPQPMVRPNRYGRWR